VQVHAHTAFPKAEPVWEPNEPEGQDNLHRYREALMAGLREGGRKAINMTKVSEILWKSDKSPTQFYERLCEAYHLYSPFNPEDPKNQRIINVAFMGQSHGDIRRKLQKLEGFTGMNAFQLLKVATKVFIS
jgi:hypothetical protein